MDQYSMVSNQLQIKNNCCLFKG